MPTGSTIHTFVGRARGDVADLLSKLKKLQKGVGDVSQKFATAARDIGRAATRVTAVVSAMAIGSTAKFASFEETMVRVGGVTQTLATDAFPKLEAAALKAGESTRFTALQSAEAMEQLGLAGLRTNEIIEALPKSLQLASAAQVEISKAAEISAKTMRSFNLEASDLTRVNDVLIAGFTNSNFTLESLFEALSKVGSTATTMGEDMEDVVAILGVMADRGVDASTAGTALRNAFIKMAAPTSEGAKIMERFNLVAGEPMIETLRKLEVGFANVADPAERLAIFTELFGIRGGPQLLTVMNAGVDAAENLSGRIRSLNGVAQELEEAGLRTLKGQFDLLVSAIDGMVIQLGRELAPTMSEVINQMKAFIEENRTDIVESFRSALVSVVDVAVSLAKWFRENAGAVKELATQVSTLITKAAEFAADHPKLLAFLGALKVAGFLGITTAIGSVISAMTSLAGFVATGLVPALLALGPGGWVILGITAIAAAVVALNEYIKSLWRTVEDEAVEKGKKLDAELEAIHQRRKDRQAELEAEGQRIANAQAARSGRGGDISGGVGAGMPIDPDLAGGDLVTMPGGGGSDPAADLREEILRRQREQIGRNDGQEGFTDLRDFFDEEGVSANLVEQFAETLDGVTPAMAAELAARFQRIMSEGADPERLDALASGFTEYRNKLLEQSEAVEAAKDAFNEAAPAIEDMRIDLNALHVSGDLTDTQFAVFKQRLDEMRQGLQDGSITTDQFREKMSALKQATQSAADAAEAKLMAERREALLKGDFKGAGLDVQAAVEERIAQHRMAEFNEGVDKLANEMLGLTDAVTENTSSIDDQTDATRQISRGGGGGANPQQLAGLFGFLQSNQGEQLTVINQINQLYNTMRLLQSGYNPAPFGVIQRFLDGIAGLQNRLRQLQQQTPVFSGLLGGDIIPEQFFATDAGTTGGGGASSGGVTVNFNSKSLTRDDVARTVDLTNGLRRQRGVSAIQKG